jgi:hypothetical protein
MNAKKWKFHFLKSKIQFNTLFKKKNNKEQTYKFKNFDISKINKRKFNRSIDSYEQ